MADTQAVIQPGKILIGRSVKPEHLELRLANRHGLVTGATGTGKTVTLQVLAEGFSDAGVPVFAADIKGDLSGVAAVGEAKDFILRRCEQIGIPYEAKAYPTVFWDIFGEMGHPIRATVQDMGALLLARLLELNEVQEGVLNILFRVAADERLPLLDLKDLRAMVNDVGQRSRELQSRYGNAAATSVGAIQRRLLVLEEQGANNFFGEPSLDINDFIKLAPDGRGIINILAADKLMRTPRLYGTFLLWMLSSLFQKLPEVGDRDKPKLVFFFDEAHLLFSEAPKALLEQIERVTRLIRSKGVGVYYVTQNPRDVPDTVSAQLGNRVQHALRAFTPLEQRGIRAAAETFRPNPNLDTERVIQELKVGEALVSVLQGGGEPSIVQRTMIRPPSARIGPITAEERQSCIQYSLHYGKYEQAVDRDSAYEILQRRADGLADAPPPAGAPQQHGQTGGPPQPYAPVPTGAQQPRPQSDGQQGATVGEAQQAGASEGWLGRMGRWLGGGRSPATGRNRQGVGDMFQRELTRSVTRSAATAVKNVIIRSIFGGRR